MIQYQETVWYVSDLTLRHADKIPPEIQNAEIPLWDNPLEEHYS